MQLIIDALFGLEFGQWYENVELANAAGDAETNRDDSGSLKFVLARPYGINLTE